MVIVNVSREGRISIPAAARRKLGIQPKFQVKVEVEGNRIIVTPVKSIQDMAGVFREYAKGKSRNWQNIREKTGRAVAGEVESETRG